MGSGNTLSYELKALSAKLKHFGHDYRYEGDKSLESAFQLLPDRPVPFTALKPFLYPRYFSHPSRAKLGLTGLIENGAADFKPFDDQKDLSFSGNIFPCATVILDLYANEANTLQAQPHLRVLLNRYYENFKAKNGELNRG